jgi:membrane protease YdiL (CAAX protease family)
MGAVLPCPERLFVAGSEGYVEGGRLLLAGATFGTLYQAVLLFACVAAFADHLEPSPRLASLFGRTLGPYPERQALFRRVARPWVVSLMIGHASAAVLFLLMGEWSRATGPAFYYLANSFLLYFLIPAGMLWQERASSPLLPVFGRGRDWRRRVRDASPSTLLAGLLVVPISVTVILVLFFPLRTGARVQEVLGPDGHSTLSNVLFVGYMLVSAAIAEEFVFRHYLFNRLAALKKGRVGLLAAAVVSSLLFCLGHGAMLSPEWLKFVQIFVLGMSLCACQARLGTEACIALHLAFNLAMILVVAVTGLG